MRAFLASAGTGRGSFFYLILLMPLASYSTEQWRPVHHSVMAVLVSFYVWRFLIQPFRAGLRGEEKQACTFGTIPVALFSILLALLISVSLCLRGPQLAAKVQAAGGAAALQKECAGFVRIFEESKGESSVWMPRDTNFPPAIASFSPQAVMVTRHGGVLLVDVRVRSGFWHHGLLISPSGKSEGFEPQMSSWPVRQITNGLWEYRE
jgi:hypothetical protein